TDTTELAAAGSRLPRGVPHHRDPDEDRVSPRRGRGPVGSVVPQSEPGEMVGADWLEGHQSIFAAHGPCTTLPGPCCLPPAGLAASHRRGGGAFRSVFVGLSE